MLFDKGELARIFIGESDKHEGAPLFEWILRKAKEEGLAGATVIRGLEGFGTHNEIHTAKLLRLSSDLPIIIEIVDTKDKIEKFLASIDHAIKEGLVTLEDLRFRFYRNSNKGNMKI
jgi:hypothetical protein